ncbi:MAG: tetratricopeptide repeat protein [Fibrobacterota bacterium]
MDNNDNSINSGTHTKFWKDLPLYNKSGVMDQAISLYKANIKREPDNPSHYFNLGKVLEAQGRQLDAMKVYSMASKKDPHYYKARFNLSVIYLELGKYNLALKGFMKVLKQKRDHSGAIYNAALCCKHLKIKDRAARLWRRFLELEKDPEWTSETNRHLDSL